VGFELTIPVFVGAKTVHALDRAATVICHLAYGQPLLEYPTNRCPVSVLLGSELSNDEIIWSGYLTYEVAYYTICLHYYIASYHPLGKVAINCCYPANKASRYITMQHDTGNTIDEEIGWELSVFILSENGGSQVVECLVA
jgi:hypothetical protein